MPERYQREIEEILRQTGDASSSISKSGKNKLNPVSRIGLYLRKITSLLSGRIWVTSILLLFSSIFVSAAVPGILGPLLWLGLILFLCVYFP